MNVRSRVFALLMVVAPVATAAQAAPPTAARSLSGTAPRAFSPAGQVVPSFERTLFPPELVMRHQADLALTAEQRRTITDAVKALQNHTIDLQWNLQAEQATLAQLLEQRPVQEQAAVAQLNKLMELEASVKRAHLSALTRIKNALTDQQVQQLNDLRGRTPYFEARELLYDFQAPFTGQGILHDARSYPYAGQNMLYETRGLLYNGQNLLNETRR